MNSFSQFSLEEDQVRQIRLIPYFKGSIYHDLDISQTLDFFYRRFVKPLAAGFDISSSTVVDCGAGYGWFSFAYLLAGGKKACAIDIDENRLMAAKEIAEIIGLADRMEFIISPIQDVQLSDDSADFFVSIETLEHIGEKNIPQALTKIKNIARKAILITTPNKIFPIIAHDTRLPFIHWLPPKNRKHISKMFGREHMDVGNEFLTPMRLNLFFDKFKPWSKCLTFQNHQEYLGHYPFYLPYGEDATKRFCRKPGKVKSLYYFLTSSLLGNRSYWVMPNLTVLLVRR